MADDKKTGEKQPGRIAQIRQSYQAIKSIDPKIGWFMLLAAVRSVAGRTNLPPVWFAFAIALRAVGVWRRA